MSRGDTNKLGEAYAFGVVWSFFMNSLGVLVLRYHRKDQEYKVPLNFRIGSTELPVGLFLTTVTLFLVAVANLFSKKTATIWGVAFTAFLYLLFTISERINSEKMLPERKGLEQFNLIHQSEVTDRTLQARAGCILVAVRDYNNMAHLYNVVSKTNLRRHDIVVMTVRQISTAANMIWKTPSCFPLTRRSCSSTWSHSPKSRARGWICWWSQVSIPTTR